ncbi:type II secretion system protein [Alcanivorax jadensis T9]|jgi:tight adherence protein B|uniref:Type II secretion system protein n=1 Tax=Alcanivorax jadensis T9 TaxID=1177181 RepID=A0ABR4WB45_9GAMM|nr:MULTISPECIES: type II secretion system F family protein [Alcanivorax]KGD60624.1 type II secretion system protein [Alcanivorax jadensis T9]MBG33088.1 type II secretion protein F [Alcanivorax sp.]MBP21539.1 type II secretion protein F [Alcanivorax sp.]MDF1636007.1 type II secretion system F family protein [Alcanivorax jadensis]|tara:strand:- start:320 stop:1240 length:921 start_codon:yes stop_codon:yes gene_type:complete
MSAVELLGMAQMLGIIAVLTVLMQLVWFRYRQRSLLTERVRQRLQQRMEIGGEPGQVRVVAGPLERLLLRADIRLSRVQLSLLGIVIFLIVVLVLASSGFIAAAVVLALLAASLWMYWRFRFQQQRRMIFESLPGIMESTLRYMSAGRSLEASLLESFQDAPPVFAPLTFRLRSAIESGRDYTGLFEDFSRLYQVSSLVLVSIALRTSARFGSSIRPVLEQVATSLRSQQELRREFLASTAETRFTAGAFTLLPLGMAAYMMLINEKYAEVLLNTDTGHTMLMIAGILQGVGVLVIWRMIQGVGRE